MTPSQPDAVESRFPPPLIVGARVWSGNGYRDHGPLDGPKVDIPRRIGGVVRKTEKPYMTYDHLLYTVEWDNGQVSKHYAPSLFCIGRFQTKNEFEAAIRLEGDIHLTVGPQGGFKGVTLSVNYDGQRVAGRLYQRDRDLWADFLEPLAKRQKIPIQKTRLPSARDKPR
jgi:hypothetical protein